MTDKEKIYDEQIFPLMKQLIDISKKEGIPMFASFQYSDAGFCRTLIPSEESHCIFPILEAISQCTEGTGVNIDKFYLWCSKMFPNESSIIMKLLGSEPIK